MWLACVQLLGLALFIISIVVLVRTSGSTSAFNLQRFVIGYIVASLVVIIITFFGCCGAIRESRCMLIFVRFIISLSLNQCHTKFNAEHNQA